MSDKKHAVLSPSGAHRWMACPGSVPLQASYKDSSSVYADEGTAAHDLAARSLKTGTPCVGFVGMLAENGVEFTDDMAAEVQKYVDYVNALSLLPQALVFVETEVPLHHVTNEQDATGTSDAIVLVDRELIVVDLKYGKGEAVSAAENPQLLLYASGALQHISIFSEVDTVRMVIHQPRLNVVDEWTVPVHDVQRRVDEIRTAALIAWHQFDEGATQFYAAGEKQCRWCKAKADCTEASAHVARTVGIDFENLDDPPSVEPNQLGFKLDAVDMIENWCKAVRAKAEAELQNGTAVVGAAGPYKLVRGKKGNRKWDDEQVVEDACKHARVPKDVMYEHKLISPTTAEKLVKQGAIRKKLWADLTTHVKQAEGGLHVAPASDKREAVQPEKVEEMFEKLD